MQVKARVPTKGSLATLKARAEKSSTSLDLRTVCSSVSSSTPAMASTSTGLGKIRLSVSLRRIFLSVSMSSSFPSRYSMSASSPWSTASSTSFSHHSAALALSS